MSVFSLGTGFGAEQSKRYISQVELERPLEIIPLALEGVNYIFCIDGGGSKTELQVLDKFGNIQQLSYNDSSAFVNIVYQGASNINFIGESAVAQIFTSFFDKLMIGPDRIPLSEVISNSAIVAGMAGLGSVENKAKMSLILQALKFGPSKQALFSDVSLTSALVKNEGAVLISGTGCVCMSRILDGTIRRAGGFVFPAEDACGAYFYGTKALNYAIQDEMGYGTSTALTAELRRFFSIDSESSITEFVRLKHLSVKEIAASAPLVFEQAYDYHDSVAMGIIDESVEYLSRVIAYCLNGGRSPFEILLVGGVFRDPHIDEFIKNIEAQLIIKSIECELNWLNLSKKKLFPLIIQEIIKAREAPLLGCSV